MKKRIFAVLLVGLSVIFSLNVFASDFFYLYIEYYIVDSDGTEIRLREQIVPEITDNRFPYCTVIYPDGSEEHFSFSTFNTSIANGSSYMEPGSYTFAHCYIPEGYVRVYPDRDSRIVVPDGAKEGIFTLKVYIQERDGMQGLINESNTQSDPKTSDSKSNVTDAASSAKPEITVVNNVSLTFNGKMVSLDMPILNVNGRTMYPFRQCLEFMGAKVIWFEDTRAATGVLNKIAVTFPVEQNYYYIDRPDEDGVEFIDMDEGLTTFIYNDRTYIPIRYAAEALGFTVEWDGNTNTINIK